jgi:alcohol dehydrogenase class IV
VPDLYFLKKLKEEVLKSLIVTDKDLIKYYVVNKVTDILIKNSILGNF